MQFYNVESRVITDIVSGLAYTNIYIWPRPTLAAGGQALMIGPSPWPTITVCYNVGS